MTWQPTFGAWPEEGGVRFRVWAPAADNVELMLEGSSGRSSTRSLIRNENGIFTVLIRDVRPGDRYRYSVDGDGPFPDPASRFQPEGVHGPSEVIDVQGFPWRDDGWEGVSPKDLVIYELHVGTFSPAGNFAGVIEKLPELVDLGITAIEIMPVADFPGVRNWGYDGVDLFAPARCYGRPEDFQRLVDSAHRLGLAVFLDVVYNHFGPDGNYLARFSPYYFSSTHSSDWGEGINFDGEHSACVRAFFMDNALYWLHGFHLDGLRLDATHAIADDGPRHFLAELSARVHGTLGERKVWLMAEDHRNLASMIKPESQGGWGLDGLWADDFHHQARRLLAGDREGYYRDFSGSVGDLAATIRRGWFFTGQYSRHFRQRRGTDPAGLAPRRLIYFIQNHDQVGNRALGERLHHQIDLAAYRAASALLLCCPQTPLLFMGQEWAASTPFLYFTDHHAELGKQVTRGRRREFRHFAAFADAQKAALIPDPQAPATFESSRLQWEERSREPHASIGRLYRTLLHLRRTEPALAADGADSCEAAAIDADTLLLYRSVPGAPALLLVVRFRNGGRVDLSGHALAESLPWRCLLSTEAPSFCDKSRPARVELQGTAPVIHFQGAVAVLLKEVTDQDEPVGRGP